MRFILVITYSVIRPGEKTTYYPAPHSAGETRTIDCEFSLEFGFELDFELNLELDFELKIELDMR